MLAGGKLGKEDGGEEEGTTGPFGGGEGFAEGPACQDGKDGFHAHDEGGDGGVGVALADDLEGVGDGGGADGRVEERDGGGT